jgi:hypothetical protein
MALAEEPLRYIRKYLNVEDELMDGIDAVESSEAPPAKAAAHARKKSSTPPARETSAARRTREKPIARPMPTGIPNFLKRPYP